MEFKDYEKNLEELKEIVEKLEKGELTLEETVKSYQKGMELYGQLDACLRSTEGVLTRIESSDSLPTEKEWGIAENQDA